LRFGQARAALEHFQLLMRQHLKALELRASRPFFLLTIARPHSDNLSASAAREP
jgi:hypothetical protein